MIRFLPGVERTTYQTDFSADISVSAVDDEEDDYAMQSVDDGIAAYADDNKPICKHRSYKSRSFNKA